MTGKSSRGPCIDGSCRSVNVVRVRRIAGRCKVEAFGSCFLRNTASAQFPESINEPTKTKTMQRQRCLECSHRLFHVRYTQSAELLLVFAMPPLPSRSLTSCSCPVLAVPVCFLFKTVSNCVRASGKLFRRPSGVVRKRRAEAEVGNAVSEVPTISSADDGIRAKTGACPCRTRREVLPLGYMTRALLTTRQVSSLGAVERDVEFQAVRVKSHANVRVRQKQLRAGFSAEDEAEGFQDDTIISRVARKTNRTRTCAYVYPSSALVVAPGPGCMGHSTGLAGSRAPVRVHDSIRRTSRNRPPSAPALAADWCRERKRPSFHLKPPS